ncbi:nitrous oxide reductase accessory protein NosL [Acidiluteibacter ferrifornacis]|uniref:Uncharacterized protein n=1 Tax=Acidiluteibacter ferrifornacis TaxID=2692424 RepID=A0A6N9NMX1_9FLAO|nr:nitrous oxide reductase accessory protein NosL [Acidiluteibacter ferrifornacis]NBG66447.1 hypothetical protein [Acidiluteibacter ferrifornacis]
MKTLKIMLFATILFLAMAANAQKNSSCTHCNMTIKDLKHNATIEENGKISHFDAIECLVNYLKEQPNKEHSKLAVADYSTSKLVDAKTAYYLKSKKIQSPMGANLSAFESEEVANNYKKKNGGAVYNWEELKALFSDEKSDASNHFHHNHFRPDSHAPIGVSGDHMHPQGGLMFSYKAMYMSMEGNLSGTEAITDEQIFNSYMNAPQTMTMQMHMLGVMYAPTDKVTLMLMQNYLSNKMDLTHSMTMMDGMKMKENFSTQSRGLGDLKASVLIALYANQSSSMHLNTGISFPIGSVSQKDDTPMKENAKLPYAMQLGSGTVDFSLGATYKKTFTSGSIGAQLSGVLRTGNNTEGYQLGDMGQLNVWGALNLNSCVSISSRVQWLINENISGIDVDLKPMMAPAANTANYGGHQMNGFLGLNYAFSASSNWNKVKFGLEAGVPIYQNVTGIQMNQKYLINAGLKYAIL